MQTADVAIKNCKFVADTVSKKAKLEKINEIGAAAHSI